MIQKKDRAPGLDRYPPCVIPAVSSGKADLQHKHRICYRCYLPVLTGFTERALHRAHTVNTTYRNTVQKRHGLNREFNPTTADCELQGTASSPSSTVQILESIGKTSPENKTVPYPCLCI